MGEHELIIEALERRDSVQTGELLLQHLRHKFEAISRHLETVRLAEETA
jgi:DNA-binding GntR family transcriptional regulator